MTLTAADVKASICRRHGSLTGLGEWVCIAEAFSGFASVGGGIDLLAIGAWRSAKVGGLTNVREAENAIVSYEVKVSRADLRRELYGYTPGPGAQWRTRGVPAWPGKQTHALTVSHYFFFATPAGLMKPEEIARRWAPEDGRGLWLPEQAGLVEVSDAGICRVRVNAPLFAGPRPFTRHEAAELIRHAVDPNGARRLRAENASLRSQVDWLTKQLAQEVTR